MNAGATVVLFAVVQNTVRKLDTGSLQAVGTVRQTFHGTGISSKFEVKTDVLRTVDKFYDLSRIEEPPQVVANLVSAENYVSDGRQMVEVAPSKVASNFNSHINLCAFGADGSVSVVLDVETMHAKEVKPVQSEIREDNWDEGGKVTIFKFEEKYFRSVHVFLQVHQMCEIFHLGKERRAEVAS